MKVLIFEIFYAKNSKDSDKRTRMSIEIGTNWPLMAIPPSKQNALQKESYTNVPSNNPSDSVILNKVIELESNTFWEKGTFIDLYI